MKGVNKSGNMVINLVFFTFLAGILAAELSTQINNSDYNWIDQNKSIIGLVFLVLFLVILKNSFGNKE